MTEIYGDRGPNGELIKGDESIDFGGIVMNPLSWEFKERMKFEQHPVYINNRAYPPGNPWTYRPFPAMLYKAFRRDGQIKCMEPEPHPMDYQDARSHQWAVENAFRFTQSCQRIVKDEVEMSQAAEGGWCKSPEEAIAWVQAKERAISTETAIRQTADLRMGELAQREVKAVEEAADGHVPEIERTPVRRGRRPGSKNKTKAVTEPAAV